MNTANQMVDMDELHDANLEAGEDQFKDPDAEGEGADDGKAEGEGTTDGTDDGLGEGAGDSGDGSASAEGEGEGGEDGKGDDFKQDDLDGIANEDPSQRTTSVPAGRVGEMAKERSLAIGIADGIVGGTVDPEAVKSLGGTVAVAKMLKSGDVSMEDLSSLANVAPEPEVELYDIADGYKKYHELMEDGEVEEAGLVMADINQAQRDMAKVEAQEIVQSTLDKRDADIATKQRTKENNEATDVASRIFTEHPELDEYGDNFDAGELARFQANVGSFQKEGSSLKQAIELTEKKLFPKAEKDDTGELSQREIAQRLKNADASNRQAPNLEKGNGLNASQSSKKPSDYTDDEWDNLSDREKSRMREDVPV